MGEITEQITERFWGTFAGLYAYAMGRDCAINGPNSRNCHFEIFKTPAYAREWERGKADVTETQEKSHE